MDFGQMGAPGFPLFFELNKELGFLLMLLTIIYFVPMTIYWAQAFEPLNG